MKKHYLCLLAITVTFISQMGVKAQVTIGSEYKTNTGALLDLKQKDDDIAKKGGRTASKGLALPRVKLTNLNPQSPEELAASIGGTGSWELDDHTALVVYNAVYDECASTPIERGTYVFDGNVWRLLSNSKTYRTESASGSDRSDWKSAWENDVIVHGEKKDASGNIIYKEFISADYGDAGRWMTTNLAGFLYDTDLSQEQYHSAGRTLSGANGNKDDRYDVAYWAYPKYRADVIEGEGPSAEFIENHHIGLLYTWDAVTAGKGGTDGHMNIDNPNPGTATNYENGLSEWDGTGIQPANTQKRRQGICPKGWHVPSDYEWTLLEQELIKNTSKYSTMDNIDNGDGTELAKVTQPINPGSPVGDIDPAEAEGGTAGHRGTAHGTAMKSVCTLPGSPNPASGEGLIAHKGGFNVLLVGRIILDRVTTVGYGYLSIYWSSSGFPYLEGATALCRNFRHDKASVYRQAYKRNYMMPVRCKKD